MCGGQLQTSQAKFILISLNRKVPPEGQCRMTDKPSDLKKVEQQNNRESFHITPITFLATTLLYGVKSEEQ